LHVSKSKSDHFLPDFEPLLTRPDFGSLFPKVSLILDHVSPSPSPLPPASRQRAPSQPSPLPASRQPTSSYPTASDSSVCRSKRHIKVGGMRRSLRIKRRAVTLIQQINVLLLDEKFYTTLFFVRTSKTRNYCRTQEPIERCYLIYET